MWTACWRRPGGLADQFELVWATGWQQRANRWVGPSIGLPQLPVIRFTTGPRRAPAGHIWKLGDVTRAMAGRPFAWADDAFTPADLAWAADRSAQGLPTLLLTCQARTGLVEAHIEAARAWAAGLSAAS